MIDYPFSSCTLSMYAYNVLLWTSTVFIFWKENTSSVIFQKKTYQPLLWTFVLIDLLTSFYQGDFWHYQSFVLFREEQWTPDEELYEYIAVFVNNNYLLFRCVVWGGALLLLRRLFVNFGLEYNNSLFCLFALYITVFNYARASLAMIVYFYGFSYICMPTKYIRARRGCHYLTGVLIMVSSFFFHHSMVLLILGTFVLFVPLNKKFIFVLGLGLPVFIILLYKALMSSSSYDIIFDEMIAKKVEGNIKLEEDSKSFFETIRYLWLSLLFYVPYAYMFYVAINKKKGNIPYEVKALFKITLFVLTITIGILCVGLDNNIMYYRILYMSILPISLLICLLKKYRLIRISTYKRILLFGIAYTLFSFLKGFVSWNGNIT